MRSRVLMRGGFGRRGVLEKNVHVSRRRESFSKLPGDRHSVSANASKTEPAKLRAVFVIDTDEEELTTPDEK
jgi:quercetin dioxygenase-like cupin family protein